MTIVAVPVVALGAGTGAAVALGAETSAVAAARAPGTLLLGTLAVVAALVTVLALAALRASIFVRTESQRALAALVALAIVVALAAVGAAISTATIRLVALWLVLVLALQFDADFATFALRWRTAVVDEVMVRRITTSVQVERWGGATQWRYDRVRANHGWCGNRVVAFYQTTQEAVCSIRLRDCMVTIGQNDINSGFRLVDACLVASNVVNFTVQAARNDATLVNERLSILFTTRSDGERLRRTIDQYLARRNRLGGYGIGARG